jgi:peptidoglycan/LPS O-acetylase OafA/YrhL
MTSAFDADVAERPASVVHLQSLTSLRFFAALVVVVHHAGWLATTRAAADDVLELGYVGVSFFFVLSGFVLTWSLSRKRSTRRFYWLRFARIWPLHAVTTAYVLLCVAGQFWIPGATGILAVVTCTHSWSTSQHTYYGLNGVSWSLSCEAFFYLLFPLIVASLLGRRRGTLAAIAIVDAAALLLVPLSTYTLSGPHGWASRHADWLFFVNPGFRFGEFLLGVALGCLFRAGWRSRVSLGTALFGCAATATVIAWLQVARVVHTPRPYAAALLVPWFGLVIAGAAGNDVAQRPSVLQARPLIFLGEASFAFYLTHQIVQRSTDWERLVPAGRPHAGAVVFCLYLGTAVTVACLTHLLVERPAERWLRRLGVGVGSSVGNVTVEQPRLSDQLARTLTRPDTAQPVGRRPQLVALPLDHEPSVVLAELASRRLGDAPVEE